MDYKTLLTAGKNVIYNVELAHKIGMAEAILLSEILKLAEYHGGQKFKISLENIRNRTALGRSASERGIQKLAQKNLISVSLEGMPAANWYSLSEENEAEILALFGVQKIKNTVSENQQTSFAKSANKFREISKQVSRNQQTIIHNKENLIQDTFSISTHTDFSKSENQNLKKKKNEACRVVEDDQEKINQIFRGAEFSAAAARAYGATAAEIPIFAAIFAAWAIKKGLEYESEAHLKNIAQDALKWVVPAARKSQTRKAAPAAPPPASREAIKRDKEAAEAARAAGKRFKL